VSLVPVVAASAALALGGADAPSQLEQFRTPKGEGMVGCVWSSSDGAEGLRCDFVGGERRPPAKPRSCDLDWGGAFSLPAAGRPRRLCRGDTAIDPGAPVVRYGKVKALGTFSCASAATGLQCRNAAGHGFTLLRGRTVRFF
jgi:hypothetical protein